MSELTHAELLAQLTIAQKELKKVRQEKADLELLLYASNEHADTISADLHENVVQLQQEQDDMNLMLEAVTEHSDTIAADLQDQKRAALEESERRFRMIVEATPVPMLISRLSDRTILYANHHVGPFLAQTTESLLGHEITRFFQQADDWQMVVERASAHGQVDDLELELKRVDGTLLWASVYLRTLEFNNESSILTALHDITERKRTEQRLKQEVRQLQIEIDRVKQKKQVDEIVETDFFAELQNRAKEMRGRRR